MDSVYGLLRKYARGYDDNESMIDIAYRFYNLGRLCTGLEGFVKEQYNHTLPFVYKSIGIAMGLHGAKNVLVDVRDAKVDKSLDGIESTVDALLCTVVVMDRDENELYRDYVFFERDPELNEEHYYEFLSDAAKKSLATHLDHICIDPVILECFAKFAFFLGQGLSLDRAIYERHKEIQEYVSDLDVFDDYNVSHTCLN